MKLRELELGTPEQFNVLIEIPKNSPVKLEYDEATESIKEDFVFTNGFTFLTNYGLIPQTLAEDSDHLDVMVLTDKIIPSGTVIQAKPIGVIKMLDRGEGDDKILAVPADENTYSSVKNLSAEQLQQFRDFYAEVARQKNKTIEIVSFLDKDQAILEIKKCAENYKTKI